MRRPRTGENLEGSTAMTLIWFIVWVIANNVDGHEPLLLDPVNFWVGALIVCIALDLSAAHARAGSRR